MPIPIARVIQEYQNQVITTTAPVLKTVVVGPHVHVRTYPLNRTTIAPTTRIGVHTEALMAGIPATPVVSAVTYSTYPDNITGAVIIDASVKVFIEGYIEMATATDATGDYQQSTLTTVAGNFAPVAVGDRVIFESAAPQVLEDLNVDFLAAGIVPGTDILKLGAVLHNIVAVMSEHRLMVKKAITGVATNGLFAAPDALPNTAYVIGDNAPLYDNKVGAGVTGQRIVWREVKLFNDAAATFVTDGVSAGHYLKIGSDIHYVATVLDETNLLVRGGVSVAPSNKGEFSAPDAAASIAYTIGTQVGSYADIVDSTPVGTGQRLATSSAIRTVFSVNTTKIITLTQIIPFSHDAATPFNMRVEHYVDQAAPPTGTVGWQVTPVTVDPTTKAVTVPANSTVTYLAGARKITDAQTYIEYQALRQDMTAEIQEADPNTLTADLGADGTYNILRRGVGIAVSNAGVSKVYYLGLKTDDQAGHTQAQAILANDRDTYCVVPLTQTTSILQSWKTHATTLSTATKGKRRIIICQPGTLPDEKIVTSALTDGDAESNTVLFSPTANFYSDGVIPGDKIVLSAPTTNEYTIGTVLSGNRLSITGSVFTGPEQAGAVSFTVTRALAAAGQVIELSTIPASFNTLRVVNVWPDEVEIGTDLTEKGYYLACAMGGMVGALPSQQPMAKIGIAGIDALHNSNTLFDDTQIETLVDAGWMVFVQEGLQASPYAIQQHTTAGGSADARYKYLSAVKNFDYVSNMYQTTINNFPAQWNVIGDLNGAIEDSLTGTSDTLMADFKPKIGAPLTEVTAMRVESSLTQTDKVEAYLSVRIPTVLNELDLHLISV